MNLSILRSSIVIISAMTFLFFFNSISAQVSPYEKKEVTYHY